MTRYRWILLAVLLAAASFVWGIAVHRSHIFPYQQFHLIKTFLTAEAEPKDFRHWNYRTSLFKTFNRRADVAMVGDSITEFAEWVDMFPDVSIANRGIGRDTTDGVLRRMPTILSLQPKKVFLMLGINDLLAKQGAGEVFDGYVKIIKLLLGRGIKVYVQSTLLCNKNLVECPPILSSVKDLNARLSRLSEPGLLFIDLNSALSDESGLKNEFTNDGIHLNAEGYAVWQRTIRLHMSQ